MDFNDSLGMIVLAYDKYVKDCEKNGEKAMGILAYIKECLTF